MSWPLVSSEWIGMDSHSRQPEQSPTKTTAFDGDSGPVVNDAVPEPGTPVELVRTRPTVVTVSPVDTYLAGLAESSRRPQLSALHAVAGFLSRGRATAYTFPWQEVDYPAAQAVRAYFASRLAPATTNRYLSALRSVMKECWRLRLITAEEHARACDVRNVRGSRLPAGRALERSEVAALLQVCEQDERPAGRRDHAVIAVLWVTGLRRAELAGLGMESLSPDRRTITVIGKGSKERAVYLNDEAVQILERWIALRGTLPGPVFKAISKSGTIRATGHLNPASIRDIVQRRAAQAQVASFAPHSLRRTHASEMLNRTDVLTVERLGGWAPGSGMVSRYDRRPASVARAAVEGLSLPA